MVAAQLSSCDFKADPHDTHPFEFCAGFVKPFAIASIKAFAIAFVSGRFIPKTAGLVVGLTTV